jgi:hypothetical protein
MMKKFARLACIAPLLIASGSAWCSASTSAVITNFRVQLVDLDPADGITPSISFDPYGASTAQSDVYALMPSVISLDQSNSSTSPFAPVIAMVSSGSATGFSSIFGDAFGSGAVVSTSARTDATGGNSISEGTVGFANQVEIHRFTLSPETGLVISGEATFTASTAHDQATEQADTGLYLSIGDTNGNFGPDGSWINTGIYADQSTTQPQTLSTSFQIFYDNASTLSYDGAVGGYLGSYAASTGPLLAAAVPESSTTTLLLAGLAAFACRLRRREAAAQRRPPRLA